EALREIARTDAGRVKALEDREHRLDLGRRRRKLLSNLGEVADDVSSLVHQVDDVLPDHAAGRIGDRKRKLLGQMVCKRHFDRYEGLEIVVAALAPAGADTRPLGAARQGFGIGARTIGIISRPTLKIAAICWRLGIACALAVRPFGRRGLVSRLLLALRCSLILLPVA